MRIRAVAAFLATTLAVGALTVGPASPARAAVDPAVGRLTTVSPVRVLDTIQGIGVASRKPVASGSTTTVVLPGAALPTEATAVLLNVTATRTTGSGHVTVFRGGAAEPTVSNLNYVKGQTVRNLTSVTVSVSSAKTISFSNVGAVTDITADLVGYVAPGNGRTDALRAGPLDALGGFASIGPTRVLDTRIGLGAAPAPARGTTAIKITGTAVPAGASAVLVNLTAVKPGAVGFLTAYPDGVGRPTASNLNFPAGRTVAGLALVPIGDSGKIVLYNGSARPLQILADVQGYVAGGDPTSVGAIGALSPQRLLDTRTTTSFKPNETRTVRVTGQGGVPLTGAGGVVLTVTATAPTAAGSLNVGGADRALTTLTFGSRSTVANMAVLRPTSAGSVVITNASAGRTQVVVDVIGYVGGTEVTVPTTTVSRYTTDPAKLLETGPGSEACRDGSSGATFVLLQVGAQSRTSPLSAASPGVALANTSPVIRLTYAQLVARIEVYLQQFALCATRPARIAIGTNTSGAFSGATAYPATTRGTDWADQVVDPLRQTAGPGLEVVGAIDVEAGFSATEASAEAWTTAFLGHTSADLVYNGSLDFCSADYLKPMSCGPVRDETGVTKTWTPAQYVRLTYGLGPGRISVLPQIYVNVPSQAAQWRNLYVASGRRLTFEGSLTQYGTSNSVAAGFDGAQGWSALHHALATVADPPDLPVATDLRLG